MSQTTQVKPERKRVSITSKRQFTIPQKFFTQLGFGKEAFCTLGDGMLIIQPAQSVDDGEFSEQILSDLIREGFTGETLLDEFKKRRNKIRPAVESLLAEAKAVARGKGEYSTYSDILGSEE